MQLQKLFPIMCTYMGTRATLNQPAAHRDYTLEAHFKSKMSFVLFKTVLTDGHKFIVLKIYLANQQSELGYEC